MSDINPFKVLGLDASLIKELPANSLAKVVESQYWALQHIYHPDKGGSEKKSKLLNWARGELKDQERLVFWKTRYLESLRKQTLQKRLELTQAVLVYNRKFIWRLLFSLHRVSQISYVDILGIGEKGIKVANPDIDFGIRDVILGQVDSGLEDKREREADRTEKKKKLRQEMIAKSFFHLSMEDGRLIRHNSKGDVDYSHRLLIGVITQATIRAQFSGSNESIFRFLGLFGKRGEKQMKELTSRFISPHQRTTSIPISVAQTIFPFFEFRISDDSYIFSFQIKSGKPYFFLEGKPVHSSQSGI